MLAAQHDPEVVKQALTRWLTAKMPAAEGLVLSAFKKPSAGFSNETLLFEVTWREGGRERVEALVARLQPTDFQVFPEYNLQTQFTIMRQLAATNVPVPRVRWFESDPSILGCPFYVMDRVDGDIPGDMPPYHTFGWLYDAPPARRAQVWWSGLETLVRVHQVDWRQLGLSFLGDPGAGTAPLDRQLDYWERYLSWARPAEPQPLIETAQRWLRDHRFAPARVSLCWGDARISNMIFRDAAAVAVLDWEMAFLGDPEADLGWFIFVDWSLCEGYGFPRLEGLPSREETAARYAQLTGRPVEHLHYYEVFAAVRFAVIMVRIAGRMKELGLPIPTPDFEANNACTRGIAKLLDLPPPGAGHTVGAAAAGDQVRIQFHLTGPGGHDWYLAVDGGQSRRGEGTADDPQVTLTAAADDWKAMQNGTLDRSAAFLGGKLRIEGDLSLLMRFEDAIARFSR